MLAMSDVKVELPKLYDPEKHDTRYEEIRKEEELRKEFRDILDCLYKIEIKKNDENRDINRTFPEKK
jgi:hypothetical protein